MVWGMKTAIRIDDRPLAEAKKRAANMGISLSAFIADSLRESLVRGKPACSRRPFRVKTFRGGGLQPGVDLDDSAALLDRMEGLDGAG
jgi:hypothetical protein